MHMGSISSWMISVPLDIFLHLNYRTQEICKIIPTNLVLTASNLCPQTMFISVPECGIGHGDIKGWLNVLANMTYRPVRHLFLRLV